MMNAQSRSFVDQTRTTNTGTTPSLLERAIRRLFARPARVISVQVLTDHFYLVTLQSRAFKTTTWKPGDKLRIAFGGMASRTFIPIHWNAASGITRLLGYRHGDSPASHWLNDLRVGDTCDVVGPTSSIDLETLERPLLLVGDETSIALACALQFTKKGTQSAHILLEVTSLLEADIVLAAMGVSNAYTIARKVGDTHFGALEAALRLLSDSHSPRHFVLTGKGTTVERLDGLLRVPGERTAQKKTKVHWIPRRVGLD